MAESNEILLPTFDDDEDDSGTYNFGGLPTFGKQAFGGPAAASASSTSLDTYAGNVPESSFQRAHSSDNIPRPSISSTPSRPTLPKTSASYTVGVQTPAYAPGDYPERPRLGKLSNGSTSSLMTAGTSIGSTPGFVNTKKGSFASIKNAFKGSGPPQAVPPIPNLNTSYPALKNPFSRFDSPASPIHSTFTSPRSHNALRKQSTASGKSISGRSMVSQSSSTFKGSDDYPLPPIPSRHTPSRMGRQGSDTSAYRYIKHQGSIGGLEGVDEEDGPRNPGEEALKVVWGYFRASGDGKISRICGRPLNTHPSLPAYLEEGADESFDKVLVSLANCGKRHAKRVIELLNNWCRSNCEGIGASEVRTHLDRSAGMTMRMEDAAAILTGRKVSTARYIMNRALLCLVRTTPRDAIGEELGMTLEQNVFNAFRTEKLEEYAQHPHRKAVSHLQMELLGELSSTRFLTISDRFANELSKHTSGPPTKETDSRIEHLLRGIQHLKLRVYPEMDLENSAEFLAQLAALYANVQGQNLKIAYAEMFTFILHPVVETATAEVNHPLWSKAIAIILSRSQATIAKPKYWSAIFPLIIVALCVSPRDIFMQHWQNSVETIIMKLRDRPTKNIALNALLRLIWVYVNRCSESTTSMRKRLENLVGICLPNTGGLYPSEVPLEPFVSILHTVMVKDLDLAEDLTSEYLRTDTLNQTERSTVLVKAIASTLKSVEEDTAAPWPGSADFQDVNFPEQQVNGSTLSEEILSRQDIANLVANASKSFTNLAFACDRVVSSLLLSNDNVSISTHASSSTMSSVDLITHKHGDVYVSYQNRHEPIFKLLTVILETLPRGLDISSNFAFIGNVFCRATFSANPEVCSAASDAMLRCAEDSEHAMILVDTYMQFVFETRHVFRDTFVGARLLESQFERVVKLWLDLLQALVGHQRLAAAQDGLNEAKIDNAVVEKIESCALFLLCSTSLPLRRLAIQILRSARDLESKERLPSAAFRYSRISPDKQAITRVIQLYETTLDDNETKQVRALPWLTSGDRHRFDTASNTDKHQILRRIAESDHPKDALLWQAIMPSFVAKVQELLPGATTGLRGIVIATVLRLQGHIASIASATAGRATPGMRANPATGRSSADTSALADHWRSYLSILCVTMSNQTAPPATPPVQRTKEAVILTPDTIGTPALFHYLIALFSWEDLRFKDAAVYALGTIGQPLLCPVSEILLGVARRLADGTRINISARDTSRRSTLNGVLWTALAHVFRLISPLILEGKSPSQLNNLASTIGFVKVTFSLLTDRLVQEDYDLQSLRRSFCIVVENLTNALARFDSSDRFFGEDMRGAIFKLCYEWCHVGRRPDVAKARESRTLQAAAEGYRGERDRAQYLDDLQAKTKLLSAAAAEAMAGLCQGRLISSDETTPEAQNSEYIVEPLTVLRWIRGMFSSSNTAHHETARKALYALIKYNSGCSRLLDEVLHQSFGEGEQFALTASFFGIVADILSEGLVQLPIQQVACLVLSKLGHPVIEIRQRAFQLALSLLINPEDQSGLSARLYSASGSSAPNIYRKAQRELADTVAQNFVDEALPFLAECTSRLSQLEAPRRQATLSILPPWLALLELAPDASELSEEERVAEHQALSNLMYIAIRFGDDHMDDVRDIFVSFASSEISSSSNTTALTKYLFEQGGSRKSLDLVTHAQRIIAFLAKSPASETVFDDICNLVEPSAMAALPDHDISASPVSSLANLDTLITASSSRTQVFSTGQLALLFAGELLPCRTGSQDTSKQMLTLLHVALVHCDHPGGPLRELCQNVFYQVLRSWICDTSFVQPKDVGHTWTSAQAKITALARARDDIFWRAEDTGGPETAFLAPAKMSTAIMKILSILLPFQPRLKQQWGEIALTWSTSCPIRHLACRSFQVFRILSPKVNQRMISDTLARLSSTIASSASEIQSFNLEVLRTFQVITQNLASSEASNFPQLFWCSVACLTTPYEDEFAEVIELLSHILDKFNLSNATLVRQLLAARPKEWQGPPHMQSLLLVGLRSSKTAMMTFDLIRRLASSPVDDLIDPSAERLLHGFVAALPWMLHSTDTGEPNEELSMLALDFAAIADTQEHPSFARLLTSFANTRFRSKDDFIRQACSLLRDFMPDHGLDVVTTLLGFVLNNNDWMREKSMQVLSLLLQTPDAQQLLAVHGQELLSPLLRLINTKHGTQALEILDLPAALPDSPSTTTIFGAVSRTGWSIANPKETSSVTKANVGAVFDTCAVETRAASAHFSVVQFTDLRPFEVPSQISLELPTPPTSADPEPNNESMGDLVGALHSLNQFFDDGLGNLSPKAAKSPGNGYRHTRGVSSSDSVGDKRLQAILSRGRKQSTTSPIYELSNESPTFGKHHHSVSESTTSSSMSSGPRDGEDITRRPLQVSTAINARVRPSPSPRGRQNPGNQYNTYHRTNLSYSSTNTDVDDPNENDVDHGDSNLWSLEDDSMNMSSTSISQSLASDNSGMNTPIERRRI